MQNIINRFSEQGLRMTPQRGMILSVIANSDKHINAEEIYQIISVRHPCLNISTVYRTLDLLTKLELVTKTDLGDGCVRYRATSRNGQHYYLVCEKCGRTITLGKSAVEAFTEGVKQQYGFHLAIKPLTFTGLCADCCVQP